MENSGILLVVIDPAYTEILSAMLVAGGERVEHVAGLAAAIDSARAGSHHLVLIDLDPAEEAGDPVGRMRSAADWTRTVPIIVIANGDVAGADARLARPLRAAALTEAVRSCLGTHRMNAAANARRDKLAALIGADQAASMVDRFLTSLADGIAEVEAGGDAGAIGHRIGGMAGMLGFSVLGAAWLSLENHGMAAWPTVRELAAEAIFNHRGEMPPGLDRPTNDGQAAPLKRN